MHQTSSDTRVSGEWRPPAWRDLDEAARAKRASTESASSGAQAKSSSWVSAISADGRYVAFRSYASNLVSGDTNAGSVFVDNRETGTTTGSAWPVTARRRMGGPTSRRSRRWPGGCLRIGGIIADGDTNGSATSSRRPLDRRHTGASIATTVPANSGPAVATPRRLATVRPGRRPRRGTKGRTCSCTTWSGTTTEWWRAGAQGNEPDSA